MLNQPINSEFILTKLKRKPIHTDMNLSFKLKKHFPYLQKRAFQLRLVRFVRSKLPQPITTNIPYLPAIRLCRMNKEEVLNKTKTKIQTQTKKLY